MLLVSSCGGESGVRDRESSSPNALKELQQIAEIEEVPGNLFFQARMDEFEYRKELERALGFNETGLHNLLSYCDSCTLMDQAAEAHCRVMELMMRHWGDDEFSNELGKRSESVQLAILVQVGLRYRDSDWDGFPKVAEIRRKAIDAVIDEDSDYDYAQGYAPNLPETTNRHHSRKEVGIVEEGPRGFVRSPHAKDKPLVDVRRYAAGTEVNCPYTGEWIIVPDPDTPPIPKEGSYEILDAIPVVGMRYHFLSPYAPDEEPMDLSFFSNVTITGGKGRVRCPHTRKLFYIPDRAPDGILVSGRDGFVLSPFAQGESPVDVSGMEPGTAVRCPHTEKVFLVPVTGNSKDDIPPANTPLTAKGPSPDGIPFGTPVEGKKGMVTSPYGKDKGYVDVSGFTGGELVTCPYTGRIFRVPSFADPPPAPSEPKRPLYGIPIPGEYGMIKSPHAPSKGPIDVRGLPSEAKIRCPYSNKVILVP